MNTLYLLMLLPQLRRFYLGQVRSAHGQAWETVTGRCQRPGVAIAKAMLSMERTDWRARAVLIDESAPTGPVTVQEWSR